MPVVGDGSMQTLATGRPYVRAFVNSEIRTGGDSGGVFIISTNNAKGGFGQPPPGPTETLTLHGSAEQFFDMERDTLEVVNGGHAIKHVHGPLGYPFQEAFPPNATSAEIFRAVADHSELHVNVRPLEAARNSPSCAGSSGMAYCGLYGHCGSKISLRREFEYVPAGSGGPLVAGVGFEDDLIFVAQEDTPQPNRAGYSQAASMGTVQILDVATGDFYQCPHISMGSIEMAFAVSTGHPDYVAVVVMEYGTDDYYPPTASNGGRVCGSRVSLWIGKKDASSAHFLDRNGLGPNRGRLYALVADNNETDLATFIGWPAIGASTAGLAAPLPAKLKPIQRMFNGVYYNWTAQDVNCMDAADGTVPLRTTGKAKQEWGGVNPSQPNAWLQSLTGIGGSDTLSSADLPLGGSSKASTIAFFEADFKEAFDALGGVAASACTPEGGAPPSSGAGCVTARDPSIALPLSIDARVTDVMRDQVKQFPERSSSGLDYVDFSMWLKSGRVVAFEDGSARDGFNVGIVYDPATRQSTPILGAFDGNHPSNTDVSMPQWNTDSTGTMELTGGFDISAARTVALPYTPQEYYDALDGRDLVANLQMKATGGCIDYTQAFKASQMLHINVPEEILPAATPAPSAAPTAPGDTAAPSASPAAPSASPSATVCPSPSDYPVYTKSCAGFWERGGDVWVNEVKVENCDRPGVDCDNNLRVGNRHYWSCEGVAMADSLLAWRSVLGGWGKNDYQPSGQEPSGWDGNRDTSFDNGHTTKQIYFLAQAWNEIGDESYKGGALGGLDAILASQHGVGGWPQEMRDAEPRSGYWEHATINDDLHVNILVLLDDMLTGSGPFDGMPLDASRAATAASALAAGVQFLFDAQIVVGDTRTVWCAQHHRSTLAPEWGRDYEPASFSGKESADVVEYLMSRPSPDAQIRAAVHGAAAWFAATVLLDWEKYDTCEVPSARAVGARSAHWSHRSHLQLAPASRWWQPAWARWRARIFAGDEGDEGCEGPSAEWSKDGGDGVARFGRRLSHKDQCWDLRYVPGYKLWARFYEVDDWPVVTPIFCDRGCQTNVGKYYTNWPEGFNALGHERKDG